MNYALITPAWNEETRLDQLISSVVAQSVLPTVYVIVSDGSTDRTDQIVASYAERHSWIKLLRLERPAVRHFAGKARAVNAGYDSIKSLDFDLVGNLDADITLPPDYYAFLISRFLDNPRLGVAGTPYIEDATKPEEHSYAHGSADLTHVSGACQFFRRETFEQIGGYMPIKGGGIDWVAVTTARVKGWETRTFLERTCLHHRAMGTADRGPLSARFRHGQEDFFVGSHPVWHTLRGVFQMKNKPVVLGGLSLILGYGWAWASRKPSPIPQELRTFHRQEQLQRLRRLSRRAIGLGS
jgi:glycosyltransferase involved in cell wall biosynthesis